MASNANIGAKISLDGEKEFRQAVTNINKEVKILASQMKLCTEQFKSNSNSQEALSAKSKALQEQINAQIKKVSLLVDALDEAEETYGENSRQALTWKNSLIQAETQLAKLENELKATNDQMDDLDMDDATESMKDYAEAADEAEGKSNKLQLTVGSLAVAMGNILTDVIRSTARAIGDFVKESIQLASDLEEVKNVVDTTFGDGAGSVYEFAQGASEAFGLTTLQAEQYMGRLGASLKATGIESQAMVQDMSQNLTGLVGDLASFYNLTSDEVYTKVFGGVVSGETEGLKQLGIVMTETNLSAFAMNQGLTKSYKSMTASEKATLRYQYLLAMTADAQGDFARTSGSYANQVKIMQMNLQNLGGQIGQALLPTITRIVGNLNEMITTLSAAFSDGGIKGFIDGVINMLVSTREKMAEWLPSLITIGKDVIKYLIDGIVERMPDIIESGINMLVSLASGLASAIPVLIGKIPEIIEAFARGIVDNWDNIKAAGIQFAQAIWQGIVEMLSSSVVGRFINNFAQSFAAGEAFDAGGFLDTTSGTIYQGGATINISAPSVSRSTVDYIVAKAGSISAVRGR